MHRHAVQPARVLPVSLVIQDTLDLLCPYRRAHTRTQGWSEHSLATCLSSLDTVQPSPLSDQTKLTDTKSGTPKEIQTLDSTTSLQERVQELFFLPSGGNHKSKLSIL